MIITFKKCQKNVVGSAGNGKYVNMCIHKKTAQNDLHLRRCRLGNDIGFSNEFNFNIFSSQSEAISSMQVPLNSRETINELSKHTKTLPSKQVSYSNLEYFHLRNNKKQCTPARNEIYMLPNKHSIISKQSIHE